MKAAVWSLAAMMAAGTVLADAAPAIVPVPAKIERGQGVFTLKQATPIVAEPGAASAAAAYLAGALEPALGFKPAIREASAGAPPPSGAIVLATTGADAALGNEGYELTVTADAVTIRAPAEAGLFYGIQTLRQLLPPQILAGKPQQGVAWTVPAVTIRDVPRFVWRGAMLDTCRHWFEVAFIKKFLDHMALLKLNTFHFHLTDDQGWRIEIRKYPRLTEVGSKRRESPMRGDRNKGDGTPYGGFYTQAELREIVAYAKKLHINVVPEIEMPGHALGALTAYPELSCTGGPFEVRTRWGVEPDVYCAGNDRVIAFVEDVMTEVLDIFPSAVIHVGGDECPKDRWKKCPKCQARIRELGLKDEHGLQSWFVQRIEKFLNAKGRRLLGWDEILEGGLAPNAMVMSWRGTAGGLKAASEGHDVVMSPTQYCYLDYYQGRDKSKEPEAIGGFVPLKTVYSFEPVPAALPADKQAHILGTQGNLWAEFIFDGTNVMYMAQPRLSAIAEIGWSPVAARDWEGFLARLPALFARFDAMGFVYRPLDNDPVPAAFWKSGQTGVEFKPREWDVTAAISQGGAHDIRFLFTGGAHRLDIAWAELLQDGQPVGRAEHPGTTGARNTNNTYRVTIPDFRKGAKYTLRAQVRSDGGKDSAGDIFIDPVK